MISGSMACSSSLKLLTQHSRLVVFQAKAKGLVKLFFFRLKNYVSFHGPPHKDWGPSASHNLAWQGDDHLALKTNAKAGAHCSQKLRCQKWSQPTAVLEDLAPGEALRGLLQPMDSLLNMTGSNHYYRISTVASCMHWQSLAPCMGALWILQLLSMEFELG